MKMLTKKETTIYNALRSNGKDITLVGLAKKLGWTTQEVLNVICPVAREFKFMNQNQLVEFMKGGNKTMEEYYKRPLVDLALLIETSLVELNTREKFKTPIYQSYIKKYKELRGY